MQNSCAIKYTKKTHFKMQGKEIDFLTDDWM
jgi:hypothetical protein